MDQMRDAFKSLFWILVGVALAHLVHYLFYTRFPAKVDTVYNTQFAATFERYLPAIESATASVIVLLPLLVAIGVVAVLGILIIKYRNDDAARVQIDNAERVYQEADKELAACKRLAKNLDAQYRKKTADLQSALADKEKDLIRKLQVNKSRYTEEIEKLKSERTQLNETISKLMSSLKQKKQ